MKKFASFLLAMCFTVGFAFSQNSTGGTNFYHTLLGDEIAPLSAGGGSALVYIDWALVNDEVVSTLTSLGYTVTFAASWSNFNTLLAGGTDLAVAFAQNHSATSGGLSYSTVQNYISGGGKMIFATWTTSDLAFANLFDANFTGNYNMTTICSEYFSIYRNLSSSCFTISNPGWGIFSIGLEPINDGIVAATFQNGDAAIVIGNYGNTIMLGYLSDTPTVKATIFSNVISTLTTGLAVPISYWWIIAVFILIAGGVVFAKRRILF